MAEGYKTPNATIDVANDGAITIDNNYTDSLGPLYIAKNLILPAGTYTLTGISRAENTENYDDSNDELKEWLEDQGYEESIVFESPSYRNAVLGISEDGRVIYSERIIIEDMMIDEGMELEEAVDHFEYNILRSLPYMGKTAPIILRDIYM